MKNKLEYQSRQILSDKEQSIKYNIRYCKRMIKKGYDTYTNTLAGYEQELKDLEQLQNLLNQFDLQITY